MGLVETLLAGPWQASKPLGECPSATKSSWPWPRFLKNQSDRRPWQCKPVLFLCDGQTMILMSRTPLLSGVPFIQSVRFILPHGAPINFHWCDPGNQSDFKSSSGPPLSWVRAQTLPYQEHEWAAAIDPQKFWWKAKHQEWLPKQLNPTESICSMDGMDGMDSKCRLNPFVLDFAGAAARAPWAQQSQTCPCRPLQRFHPRCPCGAAESERNFCHHCHHCILYISVIATSSLLDGRWCMSWKSLFTE